MRRLSRLAAVPIASLTLLAGCGSGASSTSHAGAAADRAGFCADNAKLDRATASASSADQLLQALKANQPTIDDFGKTAPSAISTKAQLLVTGAKAAIKANSANAFVTQRFVTAGRAVDAYCGQQANGSSSAATSTT